MSTRIWFPCELCVAERLRLVVSQSGHSGRARASIGGQRSEDLVEVVARVHRSHEGGLGAAVAGLGAIVLTVVGALLPSTRPEQGHAARGATPDPRRFWLLVAVAILATATEVSGFTASSVGAILLARGIASVLGTLTIGVVVDRNPWFALTAAVALQSSALLGLYAVRYQPAAARAVSRVVPGTPLADSAA